MDTRNIAASAFTDTKPHYALLDGMRGVAALMVIWYHIFEGFATSPIDQTFNHGYMAVDFFFIISGFVIGYAYDDRWKSMSTWTFMKRRLIRLHPMVILGAVLGAVTFIIQGCVQWDGTHIPYSAIMLSLLCGMLLIPAVPGSYAEVRGNGEMFPLNGPSWSLFFEYIGNILYALWLRRLSSKSLSCVVTITGIALASFAVLNMSGFGHLGVGWTLADNNLIGGFLRMAFAFSVGLLMSRNFKPVRIKGIFWICSIILFIIFSIPHIGGENGTIGNGIYDSLCTIVIFPILVYLAASGTAENQLTGSVCKFLGDISYPVYIIHYPFMYLFYAWLWENSIPFSESWHIAVALFFGNITLAYICLKLYDIPVRNMLSKKLFKHK